MAGVALYKTTCPHCGTENAGFTSVAQVQESITSSKQSIWNVFFACNGCNGGIVVVAVSTTPSGPHGLPGNVLIPGEGRGPAGQATAFLDKDHYPKPPAHNAPDHVPASIASPYIEASENLHRRKFDTSQMLSRKTLELATKRLLPGSKKSLYKRIEELKDTNRITAEMAAWAHIVRDDGNDSVHAEAPATEHGAAELLAFTETFLMYAFTLPGMIESRRLQETSDPTA